MRAAPGSANSINGCMQLLVPFTELVAACAREWLIQVKDLLGLGHLQTNISSKKEMD